MVRKIWIVACLTVAGIALTPDTAEAGRRRNRRNNCCPPPCCPQTCCNTGYNMGGGMGCNSCNSCGGMMSAPVATTTAPPPVATK
jgi:hypothetical protein